MPIETFRTVALALSVPFVLSVGGCASTEPSADALRSADTLESAEAAAAAESARTAAARAQSAGEPQYLRFKADETQLAGVQDDSRFTYFEFAALVTAELEFFDQDGRQLTIASAGRVAAIHGVHHGILVRRSDRASFVSPNPRALSLPRRPLPDTADYAEARAKLENQGGQLQAMQRAIEAARLTAAGGSGNARAQPVQNFPSVQTVQTAPAAQPVQTYQAVQALRTAQQGHSVEPAQSPLMRQMPQLSLLPQQARLSGSPQAAAPPPLLMPLAAANASASAPERGLIRVFFATASRAIVAPDDGLGLLLREAGNADEIRVTGFTDATGSQATNDALALARADAVVQILLRRGIPGNRLFGSAVGAAEYIAENTSDKGRALNRRAEVLLLKNGVPLAFGATVRAVR